MENQTAAIILAAGLGKRMKSDLPKVLHKADGKYLVDYVIDNVRQVGIDNIVVVIGHKYELVQEKLANRSVKFAIQQPQLGTGHAVQLAIPALGRFQGDLLVLCGDMPLVSVTTIRNLLDLRRRTQSAAAVLTVVLDDPAMYGRIVRDNNGMLEAIVEFRDADSEIRRLKEVNTATYCFNFSDLVPMLEKIKPKNVQSEYYLTDTMALFKAAGLKVSVLQSDNPDEGLGVNSQEELARIDELIKEQKSKIGSKTNNKY
jgi:bifunctional UDP-N-acetylglucosamine pyrophosphorylase/glucosamine-1-phosphate N-acetyltransferase